MNFFTYLAITGSAFTYSMFFLMAYRYYRDLQ